MAVVSTLPNYPTVKVDFWDRPSNHIDLGNDRVHVVLEDAIREFSGVADQGNMSKDTKSSLEAVMSGPYKICQ